MSLQDLSQLFDPFEPPAQRHSATSRAVAPHTRRLSPEYRLLLVVAPSHVSLRARCDLSGLAVQGWAGLAVRLPELEHIMAEGRR